MVVRDMKLWYLRPVEDWKPWYDRCFGFVIAAYTEKSAREHASIHCGDEGYEVWLDPDKTTCWELAPESYWDETVIIQDMRSA